MNKTEENKQLKKEIKKLRKEQNYNEIYNIYGPKTFQSNITNHKGEKFAKTDIKDLMSKGEYWNIYEKYGEARYEQLLHKMKCEDIYTETGSKKQRFVSKVFENIKHKTRKFLAALGVSTLAITAGTVSIGFQTENTIEQNSQEYAEDIEKYNNKINKYAEEIKQLNLSDTETIVKVVKDMWENIDGYGTPENSDITGYYRLQLLEDNAEGVCRHMSDDTAARLNAINPDYNARNYVVQMKEADGDFELMEISRELSEGEQEKERQQQESGEEQQGENIFCNIIGNHMVTAVDIKEDNITLIVDPTNVSMGVLKDGKINMFNFPEGSKFDFKPLGEICAEGTKQTLEIAGDYLKSFLHTNLTDEQIEKKYGAEAQNKALEKIRTMEKIKELSKPGYSLRESIKQIDLNTQNNEQKIDSNQINTSSKENEIGEVR